MGKFLLLLEILAAVIIATCPAVSGMDQEGFGFSSQDADHHTVTSDVAVRDSDARVAGSVSLTGDSGKARSMGIHLHPGPIVPESSGLLAMLVGLVGLGGALARRRK